MAKKTYVKKRQTNKAEQTKKGKYLDKQRKARPPGKRRSASGKTYYEYRVNRTDLKHDAPKKSKAKPKKKKAKKK